MENKTVLIVDDDEEIQKLLSVFIKKIGYRAETKINVIRAKEWLSSNRPILMLIDIMLPDATGIELCQWLNSQEDLKNIPVIHMSALTDEIAQEDSLLSGARDFVFKPFDFKILKKKIENLVKEER